MAVVINEFEMMPEPASSTGSGQPQRHDATPALTPYLLREIETAVRTKHERLHRLAAR
jgi:hypothetical protein